MASSSRALSDLWAGAPMTDDLVGAGGPYTLGNEGAVAEDGEELPPVSPMDVVGDSGGGSLDDDSVIREREKVKSSD